MNSGSFSGIRAAIASSLSEQDTRLVIRRARRGYEIYAHGDQQPTRCMTWPETRRRLVGMKVPYHRLEEINTSLVEGNDLIVFRERSTSAT